MNKDYLQIICCPVCKGDLELQTTKAAKDDILEGTLTCVQCKNKYSIRNGTAYLVPEGIPVEAGYPMYISREAGDNE